MVLLLHSNNINNTHLRDMAHHNHNTRTTTINSQCKPVLLKHFVVHNNSMVTERLHHNSTEATLLNLDMYVCMGFDQEYGTDQPTGTITTTWLWSTSSTTT